MDDLAVHLDRASLHAPAKLSSKGHALTCEEQEPRLSCLTLSNELIFFAAAHGWQILFLDFWRFWKLCHIHIVNVQDVVALVESLLLELKPEGLVKALNTNFEGNRIVDHVVPLLAVNRNGSPRSIAIVINMMKINDFIRESLTKRESEKGYRLFEPRNLIIG